MSNVSQLEILELIPTIDIKIVENIRIIIDKEVTILQEHSTVISINGE